jgi:acetyltransferase-like isoleucine patch superfamily enzyme
VARCHADLTVWAGHKNSPEFQMLEAYYLVGNEKIYGLFEGVSLPWEPLHRLNGFLASFFEQHAPRAPEGIPSDVIIEGQVYIEDGVKIEAGTYIAGPTILFAGAEVRFGAYIRGQVVIGEGAIVGHDTEVKHSILLPGAKAAHFAYVGDSILGRDVNLGAGTKLANVKVDMGKSTIKVRIDGQPVDTGLRKIGAILGDGVSLGCNSVTNPGTLVGRNTMAYAISHLGGVYPPNSVIKNAMATTVSARPS